MGLIAYLKEVMKSERGLWQSLIPLIPSGISLLTKLFGGGAGKGYPKFDYNQRLPQQDWSKIYEFGMAGPRREASRFSQAATKTTLPGGPRIGAQQAIGGHLMGHAKEQAGSLAKLRASYEMPWAMQQQGWQREDMLRKFLMGKQDMQSFMQLFGQGAMGAAQKEWGGGGGSSIWKILQSLMSGDKFA